MSVLTRWRTVPTHEDPAQAVNEIEALEAVIASLEAANTEEAGRMGNVLEEQRAMARAFDTGAA